MGLKQKIATGMIWLGGLAALVGMSGCGPYSYNERTDGRILTCNLSSKPNCKYVIDTVTGEYWEICPGSKIKYQLDETRRVEFANRVRELSGERSGDVGEMEERIGAGMSLKGIEILQQQYGK